MRRGSSPLICNGSFFAAPRLRLSERAWGWLFLMPAVVLVAGLALAPILVSFWLSLHRRMPIFNVNEFIGLRNYGLLLGDQRFWEALLTTLYFTVVSVSLELGLGLGLALLVDSRWSGLSAVEWGSREITGLRAWNRVVMLVPWVIPTVVSARIWEWLYQPEYGLLNYLLLSAGLIQAPINWLGSPTAALHAAIIMDVWKATPFAGLLLLGGLQTIPRELYLAARVDGASTWALFRHITLPLLTPVILIVLTFRTMDAFRVFDAVFVLTGGGPGNSTETLSIYAYKTLFQSLRFGYGAALATVMFASVMLISIGYLLLLRRRLREAV